MLIPARPKESRKNQKTKEYNKNTLTTSHCTNPNDTQFSAGHLPTHPILNLHFR